MLTCSVASGKWLRTRALNAHILMPVSFLHSGVGPEVSLCRCWRKRKAAHAVSTRLPRVLVGQRDIRVGGCVRGTIMIDGCSSTAFTSNKPDQRVVISLKNIPWLWRVFQLHCSLLGFAKRIHANRGVLIFADTICRRGGRRGSRAFKIASPWYEVKNGVERWLLDRGQRGCQEL